MLFIYASLPSFSLTPPKLKVTTHESWHRVNIKPQEIFQQIYDDDRRRWEEKKVIKNIFWFMNLHPRSWCGKNLNFHHSGGKFELFFDVYNVSHVFFHFQWLIKFLIYNQWYSQVASHSNFLCILNICSEG